MHATFTKRSLSEALLARLFVGGFAGITGGLVLGFWLAHDGAFQVIAATAGGSSSTLGVLIHLLVSLAIGASFAVLVAPRDGGALPSVLWGLVYGFLWWFLGPLTLMPLMTGAEVQWAAGAVAATLPSLYWHLAFGGVMGITHALLIHDALLLWSSEVESELS